MKFKKSTFCYVFLLIFLVSASPLIFAGNILSEKTSTENNTRTDTLSDKIFGNTGYNCFGFSAGAVFKDGYDTGFGFGARLRRPLLNPLIELTTSAYIWGASIDSLDVTSIGIEESLTLKKIVGNGCSIYSGIIAGYYLTNEKIESPNNINTYVIDKNTTSFETYITFGGTCPIADKRTLFTQFKYGLTNDTSEMHVLIGMLFSK